MEKLFNGFNCSVLSNCERYKGINIPAIPLTQDGKIDRNYILDLLRKEEYGYLDDTGVSYSVEITRVEEDFAAGQADHPILNFTFKKGDKTASFKVDYFSPKNLKKYPVIVHINFHKDVPNKYCPIEELIDNGVAVAHIYYEDVATDDDNFEFGIAPFLTDRSKNDGGGKISVWAYATIKVGEYLLNNGYVNEGGLFVAGHSRLGKTALWAAAQSDIFNGVLSNCSGCSGAAFFREKEGETIRKITDVFPFWFCKNFYKYADKENELPFDQHFLLSAIAPKKLCVVTAKEDTWADTDAQYLAVQLADCAYKAVGLKGLSSGKYIGYGEVDEGGDICFSKRNGIHFFSRKDWAFFIRNIK